MWLVRFLWRLMKLAWFGFCALLTLAVWPLGLALVGATFVMWGMFAASWTPTRRYRYMERGNYVHEDAWDDAWRG